MCANTYDTRPETRIAAVFPWLTEEIDASLRPIHPAMAIRENPGTAKSPF